MTSMQSFYQNKGIFLTGAPGFVGKVFLEKALRDLDVAVIYLLIRPKKDKTPEERLADIVESPIFDRIRSERGEEEFQQLAKKLQAVAGDLTQPLLGMSDADIEMVQSNVNVWISCAASVDFHEPLDRAAQINILGPLRQMEMARGCTNLDCFLHVSTAYVNSNRPDSYIEERLYDLHIDPEEAMHMMMNMDPAELKKMESTMVGSYPNTYSFTKSICEHMISRTRGDLPVAIVRPTCVGASYAEPFPGWVDAVNAAGALYLQTGVGILKMCPGDGNVIGDQIPVDFVTNTMFAAAWANAKRDKLSIYLSGTSSMNPVTWEFSSQCVRSWFSRPENKSKFSYSSPSFELIRSPALFHTRFFLQHTLPMHVMAHALRLVGNSKQSARVWKILARLHMFAGSFGYFTTHQWLYDQAQARELLGSMSEEDQAMFGFDVNKINWSLYLHQFCYGLQFYVMKEKHVVCPTLEDCKDLILPQPSHMHELKFAMQHKLMQLVRVARLVLPRMMGKPVTLATCLLVVLGFLAAYRRRSKTPVKDALAMAADPVALYKSDFGVLSLEHLKSLCGAAKLPYYPLF